MNENIKRILNRGGLVAVVVGIIAIVIGGGDTGAALEVAGTAATIAGAALILVRELFN